MAKLRPFATNFTRGELSEFISARPDLGPYYNGLTRAENIIVLPEGGLTRRPGTNEVAEVKYSNLPTILIPYVRSQSLAYVVEAGHGYMRFFKNGAAVYTDSGPELIANGQFNTDISYWNASASTGSGVAWDSTAMMSFVVALGGNAFAWQNISTVTSTRYQIAFESYDNEIRLTLRDMINGTAIQPYIIYSPGHHVFTFVATSAITQLNFFAFGDRPRATRIDNVTVRLATTPYEITTPYNWDQLAWLHWVQSIDVLFIDSPNYPPQKLLGLTDTRWNLIALGLDPPPTVEDTPTGDQLGCGAIVPATTTGLGVTFMTAGNGFLASDVGRYISAFGGLYIAKITQLNAPNSVFADIISGPFPSTAAGPDTIDGGNWGLTGSPMASLDPNAKEPINAIITLVADIAAFRAADVGKYVHIWGGLVYLDRLDSETQMTGHIRSVMSKATTADPAAAPAGSWTLEVPAWSAARGYPQTLEFHQGRLVHAATATQPSTIFGSASDNFENYAVGSLAADAYQFTVRSGKANPITWMASANELLMGEADNSATIQPIKIGTATRYAKGPGTDEPLGGATIPYVGTSKGQIFYVNATKTELRQLKYDLQQDGLYSLNVAILGRHLFDPMQGGAPIYQTALAYQEKPNSVLYLVREDGQLVALTHYEQEQVTAFTRFITDGYFESVCAIPHPNRTRHQVWVIVRRGAKRFVEYFEDEHPLMPERKYPELLTDCANVQCLPDTAVTGGIGHLEYLEGKTVDVYWNATPASGKVSGRYLGQFVVTDGAVQLGESFTGPGRFETGLRFTPTVRLVRPANQQANIEGIPKKWSKIFARVKDTNSLTVNGQEFDFNQVGQPMDEGPQPMTADLQVIEQGWSTDNNLEFSQSFSGPLTLLGVFGSLEVGQD